MIRRIMGTLALLGTLLAGSVLVAPSAQAAAYPDGVYQPQDKGDTIEAWANVHTDCEGTFGCWAYVKIEFMPDSNPAMVPWLKAWNYAGGQWAVEGWNKVNVTYQGCGTYRMVADAYNDAVSEAILGVNLGVVEFSTGGQVKRFHKTVASSEVRICRFA